MGLQFGKGDSLGVVAVRLSPGTDMLEGIRAVCEELQLGSGNIVSCIGSLRRTAYLVAVPLENKIGAGYGDPVHEEGPLELLSGQGSIGREQGGAFFIHLHAVMCDQNGRVFGGHVIAGESPVLITAEIGILRAKGLEQKRTWDASVGMELLIPS